MILITYIKGGFFMIFDYLADLIIGIVFFIFFISVGFVLALNFKNLYYNDVEILNIEKASSLDNEVIKENYRKSEFNNHYLAYKEQAEQAQKIRPWLFAMGG